MAGYFFLGVGHRGAAAHAPGNTMASFRKALQLGVDAIEVDVRQCGDGHLVLAHDATLPGPDGAVEIATTELAALRTLDLGDGERIVTLEEALAFFRDRCAAMIDLKGEGFEALLVDTIHRSGLKAEKVVIPGGTLESRRAIRALDPSLALSLSLGRESDVLLTDAFIDAIDTEAVTWRHDLITPERVARLHARQITVFTWTVDDPDTLRRVLQAGVDGVISNRPELFRAWS